MGVEENEALIRKVVDEFNKGNYDVVDECFANNFVNVRHSGLKQDRAGFKEFLVMMRDGFPDIQRKIEDVIVTDDRAALFFTWTGTDKWEYQGRTPTGKKDTVREIYFIRFENGKISEYRQYGDAYGMMFKFGALVETQPLEENKKVVKEFTERMGKGDSAVLDELTTNDCVIHVLFDKGYDVNIETYRKTNDSAHISFPDYSLSVDDIVAETDKVFVLSTKRGTQEGEFLGIPPTGKQINVFRGVVYRLEEGKIAEGWAMEDMYSHLSQLGVLPAFADAVKAYNESH